MIIVGCTGVAIIPWLNWGRNNGVFRFYTAGFLMAHISVRPTARLRQRFIAGGGRGGGVPRGTHLSLTC